MDKPIINFDTDTVKPIAQQISEAEGMRDYFLWKSENKPWSDNAQYYKDIAAGWQREVDKLKAQQDVCRRTVGNYADNLKDK